MIVSSILETIGNTPILHLPLRGEEVDLFIKLEMFNPTNSMKDRMALEMVRDLGVIGTQTSNIEIIESSSGNTASALSMICAELGIDFTALMDNHASQDKIRTVEAFGGKVKIVGDGDGSLATDVRDAEAARLSNKKPNTYWTEQHNNDANSRGYRSLANEIYSDLGEGITHLVSAIGTGGSLCGTGRYLRERVPALQVIGVEPEGSVIFGIPGHDYLQSGTGTPAGANVGMVIDYDVIDEGRKVGDDEAFSVCRFLARHYGLLVGGSTGGAVYEALKIAAQAQKGAKIVTLACDTGAKYLDTIFSDKWLAAKGISLVDIERVFGDLLKLDRVEDEQALETAL